MPLRISLGPPKASMIIENGSETIYAGQGTAPRSSRTTEEIPSDPFLAVWPVQPRLWLRCRSRSKVNSHGLWRHPPLRSDFLDSVDALGVSGLCHARQAIATAIN